MISHHHGRSARPPPPRTVPAASDSSRRPPHANAISATKPTSSTAAAADTSPSSSSSTTNSGYQHTLNLSKTDVIDELAKLGYARDALPEEMLDAFISEMKEQYRAELSEFLTEEEDDEQEEEEEEEKEEEQQRNEDQNPYSTQRRRRAWSPEKQTYSRTTTGDGIAAAAGHAQRVKWRDDDDENAATASANTAAAGTNEEETTTSGGGASSSSASYRMSIIERLAALDLSRVRETVARQHQAQVRPLDDDEDEDDNSELSGHTVLEEEDEEVMVHEQTEPTLRDYQHQLHEASEGFIMTMQGLENARNPPYTQDDEEPYSHLFDDDDDYYGNEYERASEDSRSVSAVSASSLGPAEAATAARTYSGRPKLYTGFIYPSFSNPTNNTRPRKKHDPVARFHAHRQRWEQDPFLRRMAHPSQQRPQQPQLLPPAADYYHHQPLALPPQPAQRLRHDLAAMRSDYVVPTEKKRAHLVWETRNALNDMRSR
ncbi:hypothetical protein BDZ88DRAFT_426328 [Geranomyces variabilis]|nr:hypothetical protein BDZ88DRAFT_426328 [Geranomyces variabilis]KAJ3136477.1 hypothetical protein HDU90_003189 [Geranomyces variabilis]